MPDATPRPLHLRLHDFALGTLSVSAIVGGIAYLNEAARTQMIRLVNGDVPLSAVLPDLQLHSLQRTIVDLAVHDHPEISAFVIIGTVLFIGMFKM